MMFGRTLFLSFSLLFVAPISPAWCDYPVLSCVSVFLGESESDNSITIDRFVDVYVKVLEATEQGGLLREEDLRAMLATSEFFQLVTPGPSEKLVIVSGLKSLHEVAQNTFQEAQSFDALRAVLRVRVRQYLDRKKVSSRARDVAIEVRKDRISFFEERKITSRHSRIIDLAISSDQKEAAAVSEDGEIKVVSLDSSLQIVREFPKQAGGLRTVAISPDGKWLVTGSSSTDEIRIWDFKNPVQAPIVLHLNGARPVQLHISPDSKELVASGWGYGPGDSSSVGLVGSWNLETGQPRFEFSAVKRTVFSVVSWPLRIVTVFPENHMVNIDLNTGKPSEPINISDALLPETRGDRGPNSYVVSLDGTELLLGYQGGAVMMRQIRDGQISVLFPRQTKTKLNSASTDRVSAVAMTNDRCRIVSGSPEGIMMFCDGDNHQEISSSSYARADIEAICIDPLNRFALSKSRSHINLWDLRTGRHIDVLKRDPICYFSKVQISANGTTIVAGTSAGEVFRWDLRWSSEEMLDFLY